jgi:hypothetical protein
VLQVNIHPDPVTGETWYSLDDLPLDALEELQARTECSYSLWDDVWKHSIKFARIFVEVALRESGAVQVGAEKATAERVRMSLLKRGRLLRIVDDETDLPQEWNGSLPDPKVEDSAPSMIS